MSSYASSLGCASKTLYANISHRIVLLVKGEGGSKSSIKEKMKKSIVGLDYPFRLAVSRVSASDECSHKHQRLELQL
eukprot:1320723-Amorphochlora_amoeboformis.AAC.1